MDKYKNSDRHKIYPSLREFYGGKRLLKPDTTLKEEYQCSKCGEKIKIDDYKKWKRRSNFIKWLIVILLYASIEIPHILIGDSFEKKLSDFYAAQSGWMRLLYEVLIAAAAFTIVVGLTYIIFWLVGRVILLNWYCANLQKNGTDPCPGEREW